MKHRKSAAYQLVEGIVLHPPFGRFDLVEPKVQDLFVHVSIPILRVRAANRGSVPDPSEVMRRSVPSETG
jgi:hypothetical protein